MNPRTDAANPLLPAILAAIGLILIQLCSAWPLAQGLIHVVVVLGIAPTLRSSLGAVLLAAAAGWILEPSLHLYPRLGGTPLADMTVALALHALRFQWPPDSRNGYLARLGGALVAHTLLVHLCVRLAAGSHVWGWGWLASLLALPLWGVLSLRLIQGPARR